MQRLGAFAPGSNPPATMFKPKSDPAAPSLAPADAVQQARTRARQRLIGAVVLLGIGIVGFPLVFETQPRPIPVDIPIEIPKKDGLPPLVAPPAMPAASHADAVAQVSGTSHDEMITESRGDAGRDVTPAAPPVASAAVASAAKVTLPSARAQPAASSPSSRVSVPSVVASPTPATSAAVPAPSATATAGRGVEAPSAEAARARALLEGKPVAAAAATDASRYVVQVGAFADANAARETRLKVEKLGLRTYTQIAQTPDGSRIRVRVGPFGSRGEADAALAKARSAGLTAVVLTL